MRIVRDTITYTVGRMASYNPINISGYHISEAGASPSRRPPSRWRRPGRR